MVEHSTHKAAVAGSTPAFDTKLIISVHGFLLTYFKKWVILFWYEDLYCTKNLEENSSLQRRRSFYGRWNFSVKIWLFQIMMATLIEKPIPPAILSGDDENDPQLFLGDFVFMSRPPWVRRLFINCNLLRFFSKFDKLLLLAFLCKYRDLL